MANEFIATFNLEQPQRETATFTIQNNNGISATFDIAQANKDKYFAFEQAESSKLWKIKHNLNKKPSVTVVDTEDRVVIPYVQYKSDNEIWLEFNAAFKGWAYLN